MKIDYKEFIVIDFGSEIFQKIQIELVNELHSDGFIENNKVSNITWADFRKLLYHHTILEVCEEIKHNSMGHKTVYIYDKSCKFGGELYDLAEEERLSKMIRAMITHITSNFPIIFIGYDESLDCISDVESGEFQDVLGSINIKIYNQENGNYTFKRAKTFCDKYGLRFLNQEYFNIIGNKHLLMH